MQKRHKVEGTSVWIIGFERRPFLILQKPWGFVGVRRLLIKRRGTKDLVGGMLSGQLNREGDIISALPPLLNDTSRKHVVCYTSLKNEASECNRAF